MWFCRQILFDIAWNDTINIEIVLVLKIPNNSTNPCIHKLKLQLSQRENQFISIIDMHACTCV